MENYEVESTINLQELITLLWKNIILIGIVTMTISIAVGLFTIFVIDEKFSSDTTLRVTAAQSGDSINYNDLQTSQKLVKTYSIIAKSRTVLNQVIEDLGLNLTYQQLQDKIEVTSVQDTDIISIKVTLDNPDDAAMIANQVATVFMDEVENQVSIETLSILDEAIPIKQPVSPNVKLNVVIGFVLGLMLSVGFVLLREFLDRTIKDEDDVVKYLELPLLGSVPSIN